MEVDIKTATRLKIVCVVCDSAVEFDINKLTGGGILHQCPVCQNSYGIDMMDNPFLKFQRMTKTISEIKSAKLFLICEETR